jgi:hypothetical protein
MFIAYVDTSYLSDSHKVRSQNDYLFTCGGDSISWRSTKQSITTTSFNQAEIIVIYEASRECVKLRSIIHYIRQNCGLPSWKKILTHLYKDHTTCITQLRDEYIKGDRTKHFFPKFFFTHTQ